jgi:hypothetical protein
VKGAWFQVFGDWFYFSVILCASLFNTLCNLLWYREKVKLAQPQNEGGSEGLLEIGDWFYASVNLCSSLFNSLCNLLWYWVMGRS